MFVVIDIHKSIVKAHSGGVGFQRQGARLVYPERSSRNHVSWRAVQQNNCRLAVVAPGTTSNDTQ